MTPWDVVVWAGALIALMVALGVTVGVVAVVLRFLEQQRAELTRYRAHQARLAAEARAAEQRAELEAADVLQQRLALPFGETTTTADQLHARLDKVDGRLSNAAGVVKETEEANRALARQLATLSSRVDQLQTRARVTHTDRPLRPGEGQR
jgi:chromosome segregation ATPase